MSLSEVEAQLRSLRLRPMLRAAPKPNKVGRPGTKLRAMIERVIELATADLGHTWDRPVHWRPIRDALNREGYNVTMIRRGLRSAGIVVWPRKGDKDPDSRVVYPPDADVPPDPTPNSRRAALAEVSIEQAEVVERGVDALGDALGIPSEEVATIVEETAQLATTVYQPERLGVRIGLVQGLRHSTRETLAGHRVRTVSDAIDLGDWLDKLVSPDQGNRLRKFARGE
jgi:hypothetical protein